MEKQEILLESGTNEMELLEFLIGRQSFGVNVAKVQAIVCYDSSTVTKVATSPPAMVGMMLHRGHTIPLIDLAHALDMKSGTEQESNDQQIVIVTEFNNTVNSFLVDGVNRIHRLCWDSFVPISNIISNCSASVVGSVNIDDTEVMVVDLEHILSEIFPRMAVGGLTNKAGDAAKKGKRQDIRIFLAEDSKTIRDNITRILSEAGYNNIQAFENGQNAYDMLVKLRDQGKAEETGNDGLPTLTITDIEMPQLDGLTLCKRIKNDPALNKIPVIMFSSLINDKMILKCKEVGADNYITKPDMNKLVSMIDEMCLR